MRLHPLTGVFVLTTETPRLSTLSLAERTLQRHRLHPQLFLWVAAMLWWVLCQAPIPVWEGLVSDDRSRPQFAIASGRASHTVIQQNLWAAFGAVALLIPATLFGPASMGIAVLVHEGATALAVLNALRLLRFIDPGEERSVQPTAGSLTYRPRDEWRAC